MKIGIDARLINETGVGRYIRNLIEQLGGLDTINSYIVYVRKNSFDIFQLPNKRWQKKLAEVPWHSFSEQVVMPWILMKDRLDLVHIPYFNVPIFYPGKFIVTIHDLTILHFDTGRATTLPLLFYKLRRFGYSIAIIAGLNRAQEILAVSRATKQEIIDHFHIKPEKVVVTYEGVDEKVSSIKYQVSSKKRLIKDSYFLYVGNAYPHKNLETLLRAFQLLYVKGTSLQGGKEVPFNTKLVLVGNDDFFYSRIRQTVKTMGISDAVFFYGPANEEQLHNLYVHAVVLVFPSLMEGFGLPGLEAMAVGTPVVCSDIAVFHEIYSDAALFFDPGSEKDIITKLVLLRDEGFRRNLIRKGFEQVKKYSWSTMAEKTLHMYKEAIR